MTSADDDPTLTCADARDALVALVARGVRWPADPGRALRDQCLIHI